MTGLMARRAWPRPTTTGRTWFTSLGTSSLGSRAAQFSRTASRPHGSILRAGTNRPEGDHGVYRPASVPLATSPRSAPPQPLVAALADLEPPPVELRPGHVEPPGLPPSTADPDSPLV